MEVDTQTNGFVGTFVKDFFFVDTKAWLRRVLQQTRCRLQDFTTTNVRRHLVQGVKTSVLNGWSLRMILDRN